MIRIGARYTFKGFTAADGWAEVRWERRFSEFMGPDDPSSPIYFLWVLIVRTGHSLDGKEVPYNHAGKHIGTWRAQLPDLDQEIPDGTV